MSSPATQLVMIACELFVQSCLMGWNNVNIYDTMAEDDLHQDFLGLSGVHMFDCIYLLLDTTLSAQAAWQSKGAIKERLQILGKLHGTNIPSEGLDAERVTGEASYTCRCTSPSRSLVMLVIQCRSGGA